MCADRGLIGRKFKATRPNQVWVSDITYVPTGEGWLYCAIVKDLFLKKVVGYAFSDRINTQLCLDALDMAIYRQRPKLGLIFHSDRGVQYASSALHPTKPKPGYIHPTKPKPGYIHPTKPKPGFVGTPDGDPGWGPRMGTPDGDPGWGPRVFAKLFLIMVLNKA